jgi:hypothetical protein
MLQNREGLFGAFYSVQDPSPIFEVLDYRAIELEVGPGSH